MGLMQILVFGVLMVGMLFLMNRTQRKQQQQQQDMLNAIKPGDEVVTIGGLYGVVDSIDAEANKITLDIDGIYLTFERGAIRRTVSAGAQSAVAISDLTPEEAPSASEDKAQDSEQDESVISE